MHASLCCLIKKDNLILSQVSSLDYSLDQFPFLAMVFLAWSKLFDWLSLENIYDLHREALEFQSLGNTQVKAFPSNNDFESWRRQVKKCSCEECDCFLGRFWGYDLKKKGLKRVWLVVFRYVFDKNYDWGLCAVKNMYKMFGRYGCNCGCFLKCILLWNILK